MQVTIIFGQIILGFFQVAALTAGLELWIGLHWLIALPLGLLLVSTLPLAGSLIGMCGAVAAWHWSWFAAAGLFFGPFIVIMLVVMSATALESSYSGE